MKTIKSLDLNDAKKAVAAMEKIAGKMSLNLCCCVLDSAANIILLERMDNSNLFTIGLAKIKASTAISIKNNSGVVHKILKDQEAELPYFDSSVKTGWKGGVPAFSPDDKDNPIGAIGISGGTQDQDEEIAIEILKAIGFYKA